MRIYANPYFLSSGWYPLSVIPLLNTTSIESRNLEIHKIGHVLVKPSTPASVSSFFPAISQPSCQVPFPRSCTWSWHYAFRLFWHSPLSNPTLPSRGLQIITSTGHQPAKLPMVLKFSLQKEIAYARRPRFLARWWQRTRQQLLRALSKLL